MRRRELSALRDSRETLGANSRPATCDWLGHQIDELILADLSGWGHRHLVDLLDGQSAREAAKARSDDLCELRYVERPVLARDEGDGGVLAVRARQTNEGSLFHSWVAAEDFLDIAWIPVFAVDGEPFTESPANEDVLVDVDAPDIAGVEPAVSQGGRGLLWSFPVAGHEPPAEADLSDLSARNLQPVVVEDAYFFVGERRSASEEMIVAHGIGEPSPTKPPSSLWP